MKIMRKYGLVGYPLSHSFSPDYFKAKFEREGIDDAQYNAYPIDDVAMVNELFESGIKGLNVTIPYKEKVIPFLDVLDPEAEAVGAVNTIVQDDGILKGYNTDVYGFGESLKKFLGSSFSHKALILGSGGASRAVRYVLHNMGIEFSVVSRREGFIDYADINKETFNLYRLVINTTPLGMYPNIHDKPAIEFVNSGGEIFVYDLIYNPEKTLFLEEAEAHGARVKNGLEMLELQAERAWAIWNA